MPFHPKLRRCVLLTLSLLSACGAADGTQITATLPPQTSLEVNGAAGAYLVGRVASAHGDHALAADMFERTLKDEPDNPEILQRAFMAGLMAGRSEAVAFARRLPANLPAELLLGNADVKDGKWAVAEARYSAMLRQGATQLLQPLLVAWTQQGSGRTDVALATLRPFVEGQRFRAAYALHAAMIADLGGKDAEAGRYYKIAQTEFGGTSLQLATALASWQVRQGRIPDAQATLNALVQQNGDIAIALPALYARTHTRPVRNARDGMAEAFLALAGALRGPETSDFALLMLRLALDLRPDLTPARILSADLLDTARQPQGAIALLAQVEATDPLESVARLRQTALLDRVGQTSAALALVDRLIIKFPLRPEPLALKGDILRGKKRFADAVGAYDKAVSLLKQPQRSDWVLFYERGIALERSLNWARAEADFVKALELSPDEPFVMNYLGYSWTEQGINLPRAKAMIERAAEKRPNDGAIIDSLGWVTMRMGDTKAAVRLLERAAELQSTDSTINMHLGDAYWAVGRKLEAQFQWRRALQQSPEPDDIPKLQAKLLESEVTLGNKQVIGAP